MKALLLIDHGSRRAEANDMLGCMAALVQRMAGDDVIVRHAHMELAEPSIEQGVAACAAAGATELIAFPYMLSPGRHSTSDIPNLVAAATKAYPGISVRVTPAFGIEAELGEVILRRAGVAVAERIESSTCQCWQPNGEVGRCGDACTGRAPARAGVEAPGASTVSRSASVLRGRS
jgi:sirohydrochlorin ferrochelatase